MRSQAVIKVALLAVMVAGCTGAKASPTSPASPTQAHASATPTAVPSPTIAPTASPSPTPAPTGFAQQSGGTITWYTSSGAARIAPQFNGLKPQLKDDKVVYLDAEGQAAEFKPNLKIGADQTGVFVVRADIVATLTKDAHDAGQFGFAIPIDLLDQQGMVLVDSGHDTISPFLPHISVALPQAANITEFNPYNKGFSIGIATGIPYEVADDAIFDLPKESIEATQRLGYVHIYSYGKEGGDILDYASYREVIKPVAVGSHLAQVSSGTAYIGCYTAALVGAEISTDNILLVNGVPLAVAQN